jgi:hypothetical protein
MPRPGSRLFPAVPIRSVGGLLPHHLGLRRPLLITRAALPRWPSLAGRAISSCAIWVILLLGLIVRLLLARDPGYGFDLLTFEQWSLDLGQHGPLHFYQGPRFADYLPGYLYFLWGAGLAARWIHFGHETYVWILKAPSIVADLASCYLLYFMLEGEAEAGAAARRAYVRALADGLVHRSAVGTGGQPCSPWRYSSASTLPR